ncbi:hypothetical protein NZ30_06280 [Xanthomonas translucens pv. undulosa]|nr:hypothetical protein NZ30_06280 [Xanthomonas translucens pv. undulosa]
MFIQYQAEESDEGWGKRGDSNNSGGGASDVCYMFRDPLARWHGQRPDRHGTCRPLWQVLQPRIDLGAGVLRRRSVIARGLR